MKDMVKNIVEWNREEKMKKDDDSYESSRKKFS